MRRQLPPAGLPQLQGALECVARIVTKRLGDLCCNQSCVGAGPHNERGSTVALPRATDKVGPWDGGTAADVLE
jgi:hypothetical protein